LVRTQNNHGRRFYSALRHHATTRRGRRMGGDPCPWPRAAGLHCLPVAPPNSRSKRRRYGRPPRLVVVVVVVDATSHYARQRHGRMPSCSGATRAYIDRGVGAGRSTVVVVASGMQVVTHARYATNSSCATAAATLSQISSSLPIKHCCMHRMDRWRPEAWPYIPIPISVHRPIYVPGCPPCITTWCRCSMLILSFASIISNTRSTRRWWKKSYKIKWYTGCLLALRTVRVGIKQETICVGAMAWCMHGYGRRCPRIALSRTTGPCMDDGWCAKS